MVDHADTGFAHMSGSVTVPRGTGTWFFAPASAVGYSTLAAPIPRAPPACNAGVGGPEPDQPPHVDSAYVDCAYS
jgi:hypothetical protein